MLMTAVDLPWRIAPESLADWAVDLWENLFPELLEFDYCRLDAELRILGGGVAAIPVDQPSML